MSSKGSGYHLADGATAQSYTTINAVLVINSMQSDGDELWWALVPSHENVLEDTVDTVFIELDVHGFNPEKFAWADPPATVRGALRSRSSVSLTDDGRCKIVIDSTPRNTRGDLILRVVVDGDVVELDPEVDVGMPGAH